MSATRPILTAVRDYLAAELPAYTVELFPDDPAGYRFMAPLGAVLVGYQGSKFARPDGLGLIGQQRDITLALTVFGRGLNHDGAALDLLDALRLAITGYRPPDCEPCHLISEQFLAEEGGAWQYQLIAQTETQQVERRPADTRPKVSSLYLRQQGQPLNPDIKPKS
jgi:gp37 protein|nr:MAG TPA: tail completion protein [Bacteriophage sp.]